jgi:plastocyanin
MKSHWVIGLGLVVAVLGTASCEGEPPKTPPLATGGQPLPVASDTELVAETPTGTQPNETRAGCTPCPCQPACGGTATATAVASDAGAPAVVVASDAGPPTVVAARGEIVGTITATPAYLASVSAVYLEDAPKEPGRGMAARIDNHQMTFSPMVQMITVGGTITFVNSDPFPHNIFSPDGKFNLGTIPQNSTTAPRHFNTAGPNTILCNLHPNMIGYIVVAPSSYFSKTDAKGHYRIKDVPAGTYKITAWAPRLATVTQSVTVTGAEATSDFELHR